MCSFPISVLKVQCPYWVCAGFTSGHAPPCCCCCCLAWVTCAYANRFRHITVQTCVFFFVQHHGSRNVLSAGGTRSRSAAVLQQVCWHTAAAPSRCWAASPDCMRILIDPQTAPFEVLSHAEAVRSCRCWPYLLWTVRYFLCTICIVSNFDECVISVMNCWSAYRSPKFQLYQL